MYKIGDTVCYIDKVSYDRSYYEEGEIIKVEKSLFGNRYLIRETEISGVHGKRFYVSSIGLAKTVKEKNILKKV